MPLLISSENQMQLPCDPKHENTKERKDHNEKDVSINITHKHIMLNYLQRTTLWKQNLCQTTYDTITMIKIIMENIPNNDLPNEKLPKLNYPFALFILSYDYIPTTTLP